MRRIAAPDRVIMPVYFVSDPSCVVFRVYLGLGRKESL